MDTLLEIKKLHSKYADLYDKGSVNLKRLKENGDSTLGQKSMNRAWQMIIKDLKTLSDKLEHDTQAK